MRLPFSNQVTEKCSLSQEGGKTSAKSQLCWQAIKVKVPGMLQARSNDLLYSKHKFTMWLSIYTKTKSQKNQIIYFQGVKLMLVPWDQHDLKCICEGLLTKTSRKKLEHSHWGRTRGHGKNALLPQGQDGYVCLETGKQQSHSLTTLLFCIFDVGMFPSPQKDTQDNPLVYTRLGIVRVSEWPSFCYPK